MTERLAVARLGDELLLGHTIDTNGAYIARTHVISCFHFASPPDHALLLTSWGVLAFASTLETPRAASSSPGESSIELRSR